MVKSVPIRFPFLGLASVSKMRPLFKYTEQNNEFYVKSSESIAYLLSVCYSFHVDSYGRLYILNENWQLSPVFYEDAHFISYIETVLIEYNLKFTGVLDTKKIYETLVLIPDVSGSVFTHPLCVNHIDPSISYDFDTFFNFFEFFLGETSTAVDSSVFMSQCLRILDEVVNYQNDNKSITFVFTGDHNLQGLLWMLDVFKQYNIPVYTVYDKETYLKTLYNNDLAFFKIIHIPFIEKDIVDKWHSYPYVFDFSIRSYNGNFLVSSYKEAEDFIFYYFYQLAFLINDLCWSYDDKNNFLYLRRNTLLNPDIQYHRWFKSLIYKKLKEPVYKAEYDFLSEKIWCVTEAKINDDGSVNKRPLSAITGHLLTGAYDTHQRDNLLASYEDVISFIESQDSLDGVSYYPALNMTKDIDLAVLDIDDGMLSSDEFPFDIANSHSLSGLGQHFYTRLYTGDKFFKYRTLTHKNTTQKIDSYGFELFVNKKVITFKSMDSFFKTSINRIYWFDYIYRYMRQRGYIDLDKRFNSEYYPKWSKRSAYNQFERYALKHNLTFEKGSRHNDSATMFGFSKLRGIDYDILIAWILEHIPDWKDGPDELSKMKRSFTTNNIK